MSMMVPTLTAPGVPCQREKCGCVYLYIDLNKLVLFCRSTDVYRITRMFCEHQTYRTLRGLINSQIANLNSKLVNTHDPCQNAIVRSQKVKFSADLAHS